MSINTISFKGVDPDQDKRYVGSNLGLNCFQRLKADISSKSSKCSKIVMYEDGIKSNATG